MTAALETREDWLTLASILLRPDLESAAEGIPGAAWPARLALSTGWPAGSRGSRKVTGQCWSPRASADGQTTAVFISPALATAPEALATLAHELVHAVVGLDAGHGAGFALCAKALGLQAPMTATTPGPTLARRLAAIAADCGPYPHVALDAGESGRPKQSARMIKCSCAACGYVARTTKKWIEQAGPPLCPCNSDPMTATAPAEGEAP